MGIRDWLTAVRGAKRELENRNRQIFTLTLRVERLTQDVEYLRKAETLNRANRAEIDWGEMQRLTRENWGIPGSIDGKSSSCE